MGGGRREEKVKKLRKSGRRRKKRQKVNIGGNERNIRIQDGSRLESKKGKEVHSYTETNKKM